MHLLRIKGVEFNIVSAYVSFSRTKNFLQTNNCAAKVSKTKVNQFGSLQEPPKIELLLSKRKCYLNRNLPSK